MLPLKWLIFFILPSPVLLSLPGMPSFGIGGLLFGPSTQKPGPLNQKCLDYPLPNDWPKVEKDCKDEVFFGSKQVWNWSTVPSSFALSAFLENKVMIEANILAVNTKLEYVYMEKLKTLGSHGTRIEIRGNDHLFTFRFPSDLTELITAGDLILEGNRKLSNYSIETWRLLFPNGTIEPYGECNFDYIANLTEEMFEDCEKVFVKGDLVIEGRRKFLGTSAVVKEIGGCLIVKNTQLTSLQFLQLTKNGSSKCRNSKRESEIVDNPYLCISRDLQKSLPKVFPKLKIANNEDCNHVCTGREAVIQKISGCRIISTDLYIPAKQSNEMAHLESVEELHGRLLIKNTEYESIQFLRNLKRIYSSSIESTVDVARNQNLKTLNLSSLEIVSSSADLILNAWNNDMFLLPVEPDYEKWLKLAHGQQLRLNVKVAPNNRRDNTLETVATVIACLFLVIFIALLVLTGFGIRPDRRTKKEKVESKME